MHPIERLRWVARSPEGEVSLVAAEAADALAGFADDPAGLVIASRRLIERRPAAGPLWWLASRALPAPVSNALVRPAASGPARERGPPPPPRDLPRRPRALVRPPAPPP